MGPKKGDSCDLGKLFKLIEEIKTDLASKATEAKLNELTAAIKERDLKIEILESKIAVMENAINKLSISTESNEQYSRRTSLRIFNIPLPEKNENGDVIEDETADICLRKVKEVIQEAGVDIPEHCIDRAHRIGKIIEDNDSDEPKKQAMIVKFTTWRHRTELYRARKKVAGKKIYLDLTSKRFQLLKRCQTKVKDDARVRFVFVDVNCSPCVSLANGKYIHFSTESQLDDILSKANANR